MGNEEIAGAGDGSRARDAELNLLSRIVDDLVVDVIVEAEGLQGSQAGCHGPQHGIRIRLDGVAAPSMGTGDREQNYGRR